MTSQIPITFVHQVYRETLLNDDDEDTNENDYVDIEVSTPCLQGYILSETSFPRDVNVIFCSILQPSSDTFTPVSAIISDGETNKSLDDDDSEKPKKSGVKLWVLAETLTVYCLRFQI